jgi:hypothetical protein
MPAFGQSGINFNFETALKKLTYHVQSIKQIPGFKIEGGKGDDTFDATTFLGNYTGVTTEAIVKADSNKVIIEFIDTEMCIFENVFIPWMESIVYGFNEYSTIDNTDIAKKYPFIRSDIIIYLFKGDVSPVELNEAETSGVTEKDVAVEYKFNGAFPIFVDTPNLSYGATAGTDTTRSVTFAFNNMSTYVPNPTISIRR